MGWRRRQQTWPALPVRSSLMELCEIPNHLTVCGNRLEYSRAILDAIHSGELAKAKFEIFETFNLHIPTSVSGVPPEILNPRKAWKMGEADFQNEVTKLAKLFLENFKKYQDEATPGVIGAG